jgi:hypothetical protein
VPDKQKFRTGMGLTEDDTPALLRSSSHVDESFENGLVVSRALVEHSEYVDEKQHGPDRLKIHTYAEEGQGLARKVMETVQEAELQSLDNEQHKAAAGFAMEAELSLGDLTKALSFISD